MCVCFFFLVFRVRSQPVCSSWRDVSRAAAAGLPHFYCCHTVIPQVRHYCCFLILLLIFWVLTVVLFNLLSFATLILALTELIALTIIKNNFSPRLSVFVSVCQIFLHPRVNLWWRKAAELWSMNDSCTCDLTLHTILSQWPHMLTVGRTLFALSSKRREALKYDDKCAGGASALCQDLLPCEDICEILLHWYTDIQFVML